MKLIKILSVYIIVLFLTSCIGSFSNRIITKKLLLIKAPYSIPLHENPQVGDYTILRSSYRNKSDMKISVIGVNPNEIILKMKAKINTVPKLLAPASNHYFEYVVDMQGITRKAYLINPEKNTKNKLEIEKSLKNKNIVNASSEFYILSTKAGKFKSKLYWRCAPSGKRDICDVKFISSRVNFKIVRAFTIPKNEFNLFNKLSKEAKSNYMTKTTIEVSEQGNVKTSK